MGDWSDSKKFWFDTGRTLIIAIAGGIAALLILKPWESSIEYKTELDKAKLSLKADVVDEYLGASYMYTATAYDAFRGDQDAVAKYQSDVLDQYKSATNRLSVYFGESLYDELVLANDLNNKMRIHFNNKSPQQEWEPVRKELKRANNEVARKALQIIKLSE